MKKRYLNLSLEELLEDDTFLLWLRSGSGSFFNELLETDPDFSDKVQKARKLYSVINDQDQGLSDIEIEQMRYNIESYFDSRVSSQKKVAKIPDKNVLVVYLRPILRYAAVIALVLLSGSLAYTLVNNYNFNSVFSRGTENLSSEPSLILSDGDVIPLEDNSRIVVRSQNEIVINNDKHINIKEEAADQARLNEIIVPYGKKSFLILDDSTKVWLCAGSRLAFPQKFSDRNREVFLQGEAYFEVTHMPEKMFLVRSNDVTVKVLGTKFYMTDYNDADDVVTVLLEGKVGINGNSIQDKIKKQTVLKPGEKAVLSKDDKKFEVSEVEDTGIYIAWTKGWFYFHKESPSNVMKKLERYYNVDLVCTGFSESDDQISGKLDLKDSITDVLATLSEIVSITYKIRNDTIYVEYNQNQKNSCL